MSQAKNSVAVNAEGGVGKEKQIYSHRFTEAESETRRITWKVLCESFFQSYIPEDSTVLDVGAGDGHFICQIRARRRIALDLGKHAEQLAAEGVEVIIADARKLAERLASEVDVVMMSNFLEHLPDKRSVIQVLEAVRSVLRPNGRLIILQPNIRFVGVKYWDYVDHHIALTDHSLVEALEVTGYRIDRLVPRFLPYTAKSAVGRFASRHGESLIRLYLKVPLLWRFFGEQTLVIASPNGKV